MRQTRITPTVYYGGNTVVGDSAYNIKIKYESNPNTNAFEDLEKEKLGRITSYVQSVQETPNRTEQDVRFLVTTFNPNDGTSNRVNTILLPANSTNAGVMKASDKIKLDGLVTSPFRGEFLSVEAATEGITDPRPGDYIYVDLGAGSDVVKYLWDSSDNQWVLQQGAPTAETPQSIMEKYESNGDRNAYTDASKIKVDNINEYVSDINQNSSGPVTLSLTLQITNPATGEIYNKPVFIPGASRSSAGLLSSLDKIKLDSLTPGGVELTYRYELDLSQNLNGVATTFDVPAEMIGPVLYYNGIRLTLDKHYTVEGNTLTINFAAPSSEEELLVEYLMH